MLVEVRGTGFVNKGAELMLRAIVHEVGGAFPVASFAMATSADNDYVKRARLGLYQKIWHQRYRVQWGKFGWVIPRSTRKRYGLVIDGEVNVVLDASGFAYSDQWGERPTVQMASYVKAWKKRGTKVVLLPQAMGPFTSQRIREAFSFIASNAEVVFARDAMSYRHVVELVGERQNIQQAPDFTNLLTGILPDGAERFNGRFCLIPNCRMMDKVAHGDSQLYPSFCAACIRILIEFGHKPFILIHEGQRDRCLAERIVHESGEKSEIIEEPDALRIKGILGLCAGVISSRFHGLVSALSQGVPALATGWSHKYEMLFKEYDIVDGCLPVTIEEKALAHQIERITREDSRREIVARITKAAVTHKGRTEMMWQKVFSVVRS